MDANDFVCRAVDQHLCGHSRRQIISLLCFNKCGATGASCNQAESRTQPLQLVCPSPFEGHDKVAREERDLHPYQDLITANTHMQNACSHLHKTLLLSRSSLRLSPSTAHEHGSKDMQLLSYNSNAPKGHQQMQRSRLLLTIILALLPVLLQTTSHLSCSSPPQTAQAEAAPSSTGLPMPHHVLGPAGASWPVKHQSREHCEL